MCCILACSVQGKSNREWRAIQSEKDIALTSTLTKAQEGDSSQDVYILAKALLGGKKKTHFKEKKNYSPRVILYTQTRKL